MTLNDFERQNRGFYSFLAISGCDTSLYHLQGESEVNSNLGPISHRYWHRWMLKIQSVISIIVFWRFYVRQHVML